VKNLYLVVALTCFLAACDNNSGTAPVVIPDPTPSTDITAPVVTVPAAITVVATSAAGAAKTATEITAFLDGATATDAVDGTVAVTNNAPDTLPIGDTTVVFTATDAAGNAGTGSAVVTVTGATEQGTLEKGPLANATVFFDYDGDKFRDANEPSANTAFDGSYALAETSIAPDDYLVVASMNANTTDALSGESYADSGVTLEAMKGGSVITPLTTLYSIAVTGLDEGETLSTTAFSAALGIPAGVDINTYSAFAKDDAGAYIGVAIASQVEAVAQSLMTALEVISESVISISETALQSGTGLSQSQAAQMAMRSLADVIVATVATNTASGTIGETLDLTDATDIAEINTAVVASLKSTEAGSLGALIAATAATAGVTADIAAAEVTGNVVLALSVSTITTVSQAFNDLSDASFGTAAASAVSLIKAQAVAEIAAAAQVVVTQVKVQQDAGATVVLTVADVDVSSIITLDDPAKLAAKIAANLEVVEAYLDSLKAPVITSASSFSVAENQTAVGTVVATDTVGDVLTYSLSGADASSFVISSSGVLSFVTAPDYETKASYTVIVTVTDSDGNFVSQTITITITDVDDNAPIISSAATFTVAENQTAIGKVVATSPSDATLTYTLSGADAKSLTIAADGVLAFVSAPDYEVKASYSVTVTVSAGSSSSTQAVTVTVTDLADTFDLADTAVTLTDYYPLDGSTVTNTLAYTVVSGMANVDLRTAPLNLTNMENAIYAGDFKTPVISFGLSSLPIGSGTDTVTISLLDGLDSTYKVGERQVNVELSVDWESDGTTASITIPAQTLTASYTTVAGVTIEVSVVNGDSDILAVKASGATYPATLEVKLVALLTQFSDLPLADLFSAGIYNLDVTTSMPLKSAAGDMVDGVNTIVEIADAFKLADATVTLQDTDSATTQTDHEATLVDGFLTLDLRSAPLSLQNIQSGLNGNSFYSPTLSFDLAAIPTSTGTEKVTINLIDGVDSTRDSGERQVTVELNVAWDADGSASSFTVPAQTISAYYLTEAGVKVAVSLVNSAPDVLSVTSAGAAYPASLEIKLLSLITKLDGLPLADILGAGFFHIDVTTDIPLVATSGLAIDGIAAIIEISDAFTLADATVTLKDTDDATTETSHEATLASGILSLDLRSAPLSLLNIQNGLNGLDFYSPTLSFGLGYIPTGAATDTVTITLVDGFDSTRDTGERQVSVALNVAWTADGSAAAITVPAQTLTASYITEAGVSVEVSLSNDDADVLSVTSAGASYPAALEVKLLALIAKLNELPLADILSAGFFTIDVTTSIPLKATDSTAVTGLSAIVEIK
jgi:hypothetical protein